MCNMHSIQTYLMSSYSPSGGIKEIACSVSNLLNLTHWWNWQSSIAIELLDLLASSPDLPLESTTILSLIPNLHSGMPDKYDFIMTLPATCALKTCPWGLMSKLTYSRTSRKSSLRRYLIPSRLHPIWPVTWLVIAACSSRDADFIP